MDSEEIKKELAMTYDELVNHLLHKYGKGKYDYFCDETCEWKNRKVSRTREGLYCHHIDEDKSIRLSDNFVASIRPYEYQKADRLVYCNMLEHVILHIKIMEYPHIEAKEKVGIGGVELICPEINDYFNGYIKEQWQTTGFSLIENNFEDYIEILKYFLLLANKQDKEILENRRDKDYKKKISQVPDENKKDISRGSDKEIVKKVYDKL